MISAKNSVQAKEKTWQSLTDDMGIQTTNTLFIYNPQVQRDTVWEDANGKNGPACKLNKPVECILMTLYFDENSKEMWDCERGQGFAFHDKERLGHYYHGHYDFSCRPENGRNYLKVDCVNLQVLS